jgi:hypothetical protein
MPVTKSATEPGARQATSIVSSRAAVIEFGAQAVFGSIHRTCLPTLVTDRAMEAWYHSSIA